MKRNAAFYFRFTLAMIAVILILSLGFVVSPRLERAFAEQQTNTSNLSSNQTGNYIINYIYQIELNTPKIQVDKSEVAIGHSFSIDGTNFDNSSKVQLHAFKERKILLENATDNQVANRTMQALLLVDSNILLKPSATPKTSIMEQQHSQTITSADAGKSDNGTLTLAAKFLPNISKQVKNFSANIECDSVPGAFITNSKNIHVFPGIINLANNSLSSRQFIDWSLPAGNYVNCEIVVSLLASQEHNNQAGTSHIISRSSSLDFTVVASNTTNSANTSNLHSKANIVDKGSVIVYTNKAGTFRIHITPNDSISPGSYVFMARQLPNSSINNTAHQFEKIAITHVQIIQNGKLIRSTT